MCKKTALLVLYFIALLSVYGQPLAPPSSVRQFKVRYSYSCKEAEGSRELLVDAENEEDARSIVENIIPCAVILKVTEVILYQEKGSSPRMGAGAKNKDVRQRSTAFEK
jgi:hypothetical protein